MNVVLLLRFQFTNILSKWRLFHSIFIYIISVQTSMHNSNHSLRLRRQIIFFQTIWMDIQQFSLGFAFRWTVSADVKFCNSHWIDGLLIGWMSGSVEWNFYFSILTLQLDVWLCECAKNSYSNRLRYDPNDSAIKWCLLNATILALRNRDLLVDWLFRFWICNNSISVVLNGQQPKEPYDDDRNLNSQRIMTEQK